MIAFRIETSISEDRFDLINIITYNDNSERNFNYSHIELTIKSL